MNSTFTYAILQFIAVLTVFFLLCNLMSVSLFTFDQINRAVKFYLLTIRLYAQKQTHLNGTLTLTLFMVIVILKISNCCCCCGCSLVELFIITSYFIIVFVLIQATLIIEYTVGING